VVGIEIRKKGVIREAISNYLKAIAIDSEDEVLYCNLARVYYGQGNHEKAIDQGEIGVEIKVRF